MILDQGIQPRDWYNSDESGFRIGIGRPKAVITKHYNSKVSIPSSSERELVTVLETISADGWSAPPWIILPGQNILAGWDGASLPANYMLAMSESGYTNDQIGLDWIQWFDKVTQNRSIGAKRLLLLDNHTSHCTYEFVEYCKEAQIVLFSFPPHMTHLMQPLDVAIFQPYKHHHSELVDAATRSGCINFNKLEFLAGLAQIRKKTMLSQSIQHAFARTGLNPYDPQIVLRQMRENTTPPRTPEPQNQGSSELGTPVTVRTTRRIGDSLWESPNLDNLPERFQNRLAKFIDGAVLQAEQAARLQKELVEIQTQRSRRNDRQNQAGRRRIIQKGGYLSAGALHKGVLQRNTGVRPRTNWEESMAQRSQKGPTEPIQIIEWQLPSVTRPE